MNERPPGLLVSVRSAAEAEAALAGGADLIDVKEPARGALGRADDAVIAEVLQVVAGRRPVSAALGELAESPAPPRGPAYVKWGLAGAGADWAARLADAIRRLEPTCRPVAVAYADWQRAGAPPPEAVADFAARHSTVWLIDTFVKDGRNLLDWLTLRQLAALCERARDAGVPIALAGSLDGKQIEELAQLRPDWFAVRGAACPAGRRDGTVSAELVSRLQTLIAACQR